MPYWANQQGNRMCFVPNKDMLHKSATPLKRNSDKLPGS